VVTQGLTCAFSIRLFEITDRGTRNIIQHHYSQHPPDESFPVDVSYMSEPPPLDLAATLFQSPLLFKEAFLRRGDRDILRRGY
jgi:hypothetical protein